MEPTQDDVLGAAKNLMTDLLSVCPALRGPDMASRIKGALRAAERQWVLYLLLIADPGLTREVMPELLQAGLRHRDALLVRGIIGRLPRSVLAVDLPPLIESRLSEADEDEFRRMAELLDHLGLLKELNALAERAKESGDPDVREAAEEFLLYGKGLP